MQKKHPFNTGRFVALFLFLTFSGWAISKQQVPLRKNIDDLTAEELAAYRHAISILKNRSEADPCAKDGYRWQAWVHNRNRLPESEGCGEDATPGMCEHHSDLFLAWHRAELYYFEKILQRTDPEGRRGPSTRNVTIPYWNWTREPSGNHFPKAFEEQENNPLYHQARNPNPIRPFPPANPYRLAATLNHDWRRFGGGLKEDGGGYGSFEPNIHDAMHVHIGGPEGSMSVNFTAADDPIFFSFHAYIDLVFEEWINRHGSDSMTSTTWYLRGTQPEDIPRPPGYVPARLSPEKMMARPKDLFDITKLGYGYQVLAKDRFKTAEELAEKLRHVSKIFGRSPDSRETILLGGQVYQPEASQQLFFNYDLVIPEDKPQSVLVKFEPVVGLASTYGVNVYLHPQGVPPQTFINNTRASYNAKSRYLVQFFSRWMTMHAGTKGHGDAGGLVPNIVDLTQEVSSLVDTQKGQRWNVTLVINLYPSKTSHRMVQIEMK